MNEADLKKLVEAARARYAAMSRSDKLRHDYMQRRSFVRARHVYMGKRLLGVVRVYRQDIATRDASDRHRDRSDFGR